MTNEEMQHGEPTVGIPPAKRNKHGHVPVVNILRFSPMHWQKRNANVCVFTYF